jgi:hypothetical protein
MKKSGTSLFQLFDWEIIYLFDEKEVLQSRISITVHKLSTVF